VAYCDRNSIRRDKGECNASESGCLWLVDETGAYPVRAHCMGGGMTTKMSTNAGHEASSMVLISDVVNRKLIELMRKEQATANEPRTYFNLTAEEGLETLLSFISPSVNESSQSAHGPLLQTGTRLELATVDASQKRIVRKRVSDIWGSKRGNQVPLP
jgi:hypothetical protein